MSDYIRIKNKRAGFEYEFIERFVAGIVLTGTEVKSIRQGKANLSEAYCRFIGSELFIQNLHISEYSYGGAYNHAARRERKLLLNRKELVKLQRNIKEKGLTVIPTALFVNRKGWAKLDIAIARGKKTYDKREDLKRKDAKREMDRMMKH